jgi:hypothetical protein
MGGDGWVCSLVLMVSVVRVRESVRVRRVRGVGERELASAGSAAAATAERTRSRMLTPHAPPHAPLTKRMPDRQLTGTGKGAGREILQSGSVVFRETHAKWDDARERKCERTVCVAHPHAPRPPTFSGGVHHPWLACSRVTEHNVREWAGTWSFAAWAGCRKRERPTHPRSNVVPRTCFL